MDSIPRRQALKTLGAAGAGALIGASQVGAQPGAEAGTQSGGAPIVVSGARVELVIEPVSRQTVRISLTPAATPIPLDGSLVKPSWARPAARITTLTAADQPVRTGDLTAIVSSSSIVSPSLSSDANANALTIRIEAADGRVVQQLRVDAPSGAVTFPLGDAPVLGFGQGGPQFDRRGIVDRMRSGAGAYQLRTHGGRVPVPWLIGTSGWAMFIHQPSGTFDLTSPDGRFTPATPGEPLDIFVAPDAQPHVLGRSAARSS